jgi:3'(2'), 5'-bisphosphate nucleotidase
LVLFYSKSLSTIYSIKDHRVLSSNHQFKKELEFSLRIVAACARITRAVQETHIVNQEKADRSPVTIADYAVQAYVAQALKAEFPQDVLIGEESSGGLQESEVILQGVTRQVQALLPQATPGEVCAWIDHGKGEPGRRFWVLDPVDGTKGFLRRMQYATALALVEDGEVVLGVLGCPELDFGGLHGGMAYAALGQGAWWQALDGSQTPQALHVSAQQDLPKIRILRSYEDSHTNSAQIDALAADLGITAEPVRMDSQVKYVLLAGGQAELLLRLLSSDNLEYRESIWDQAPAYRVLLEAGGSMTDMYGRELDFTAGRKLSRNQGVIASNGLIHTTALNFFAQNQKNPNG